MLDSAGGMHLNARIISDFAGEQSRIESQVRTALRAIGELIARTSQIILAKHDGGEEAMGFSIIRMNREDPFKMTPSQREVIDGCVLLLIDHEGAGAVGGNVAQRIIGSELNEKLKSTLIIAHRREAASQTKEGGWIVVPNLNHPFISD
jgi:hypothetical protein